MTIIAPTVNRIVHYYPEGSNEPLAAIIVHVWNDRCVNLSYFDRDGTPHGKTSVVLLQEGDAVPIGAEHCAWMPYQKGQAAKTEALESALKLPVVDAMTDAGASDERVRLFLNRGTLVKVNGIPLELEHDVVVLTHAGNVPLLSRDAISACKSEVTD